MKVTTAGLYVRSSTIDKGQEVGVQEELLIGWVQRLGYEPVVYSEPGVSGAKTSRPVLDRLMAAVRRREVQAVAILRLDRLGRSLSHLLLLLAEFEANNVRLLIHDMSIDTDTPQGKLFFGMVAVFAEFERALIGERVKEGLAYVRTHGTKSGKPIGRPTLDRDFVTICDILRERRHEPGAIAAVAREFAVSRAWLYKWILPVIDGVTNPPPVISGEIVPESPSD